MIKALNVAATTTFICEDDRKSVNPTKFHLKAMDGFIEAIVNSKMSKFDMSSVSANNPDAEVDFSIDPFAGAQTAVKYCLTGWEGFGDHKGDEIKFKSKKKTLSGMLYDTVDDDLMRLIPKDVVMELYSEIQRISTLSGEESKNSEGE